MLSLRNHSQTPAFSGNSSLPRRSAPADDVSSVLRRKGVPATAKPGSEVSGGSYLTCQPLGREGDGGGLALKSFLSESGVGGGVETAHPGQERERSLVDPHPLLRGAALEGICYPQSWVCPALPLESHLPVDGARWA